MKHPTAIVQKNRSALILLMAGWCIITAFTSFNITHQEEKEQEMTLKVIKDWYHLFLKLEEQDPCAYPPIAARRIFEIGITGWNSYYRCLDDLCLDERKTCLVLNEVYADQLKKMFEANGSDISFIDVMQTSIRKSLLQPNDEFEQIACYASEIGDAAFQTIPLQPTFTSNQALYREIWPQYTDPVLPGSVLPGWGYQPTYLFKNSEVQLPPPYDTSECVSSLLTDALSVYYTSQQLTQEQKWIADFWSDDVRGLTYSPPDRWVSIGLQLLDKKQMSVSTTLEIMAKLGIGLNDAVTLCWKYKYHYNISRPQKIIRQAMDSLWHPYHENPTFPSYPSGHAVIGSVASTILTDYFGNQTSFTDQSHAGRIEFLGTPRHYTSLSAMEEENARSRIYMGVHYPADCVAGMKLGRAVGKNVVEYHINSFHRPEQ